MATLNSTTYTNQAAGKTNIPAGPTAAGAVVVQQVSISVPSTGAGTAANDTLGLFYVPKGATLRDFRLDSDDLDANGSPTIVLDVGDSGSATRIISGSVIAKTGGRDYAARSAYGYQFTADTGIFVTVNTAGSTKAAGTLVATIEYTMEGSAS